MLNLTRDVRCVSFCPTPTTFRIHGFYDGGAWDSKTPLVWELLLSWRCKNSCGRSTEQSDNLPTWHKTVLQTKSLKIDSPASWERIDTFLLNFPVNTCLDVSMSRSGMHWDGWSEGIMLQRYTSSQSPHNSWHNMTRCHVSHNPRPWQVYIISRSSSSPQQDQQSKQSVRFMSSSSILPRKEDRYLFAAIGSFVVSSVFY